MGIRNPNSTDYVHADEPNLLNIHKAMAYNANGEPCIRILTSAGNGDAVAVNKSSVVESNNTVVANTNAATVITDMELTLGAGEYLVTFNSQYADTLGTLTATAAADLAILYDYLMELPATVTNHASEYGSETLGPGVYTQAGASSIAGTLTLDAGGNADAIFVFRSVGALTAAPSSAIVLTNGAVSNNVWWVAEGAISTGSNSVIRGSLLANQAAVSTGAGTQVEGRMLAIEGAVTVGDTSILTEPTGTSTAPLGSIALFSIFAAIGGIGNTGASEIALSIGTNSGAIAGFETATVTGEIYPGGQAELAVISYGVYVDDVLVADSVRGQTHTTLVSGWPMTLQTLVTLTSAKTIDVRVKVPIGEFAIGPGMSFVAVLVSDVVDFGVQDRITSPNGVFSTVINNAGVTTAPGAIMPLADNTHDLGSADLRWRSVYVGPGSLYLDTAILTVEDNALKIQGVDRLDIQELRFFENTIESTEPDVDIQIGQLDATADVKINRNTVLAAGKTFGLVDTVTLEIARLSVTDGVLNVDGANQLQVGQLKFIDNTIQSTTTDTDIQIGEIEDNADLVLNRNVVLSAGRTFGLVDTVTLEIARLSVTDGVLNVDGANQLQVGQLKFVDNTIQSTTTDTDIQIGETDDNADLVLNRNVIIAEGKTLTGGGAGGSGETYTGDLVTINIDSENQISVVNLPNEVIGPVQGIEFDITHEHVGEEVGTLCWNPDDDTLNIQHTDGVTQQVGQELYVRVWNTTGSTIANGTVVRFDGASINGEAYLEVAPLQANGVYPSLYAVGVATQDIDDGDKGYITVWGKVRTLNTTGGAENWTVGDILYASPTTVGGFTKIKPTAPNNVVPMAAVLRVSATEGEIFVRPTIEQKYSYGRFARTTDAAVVATNTAYALTFNSTETSNGVSISDPASRLIVDQSGLYQIDINAQIEIGGNKNATGTMYLWVRKNGTDVANSMRRQGQLGTVPSLSFSYNIVISLAANDYIEVAYAADDTDMRFDATAATAFGPTTAAVLIGITQIQL